MKLPSILWPWGRLIELERELAEAAQKTTQAVRALGRESIKREDAESRATLYRAALEDAVDDLRAAYFRDPSTGRMGRKGQRFANTKPRSTHDQ